MLNERAVEWESNQIVYIIDVQRVVERVHQSN